MVGCGVQKVRDDIVMVGKVGEGIVRFVWLWEGWGG